MKTVSPGRRRFAQALLLAPTAPQVVRARPHGGAAARPKTLRYAFRVAETGFDPAQVNDLYSSNVNANIFDAPLTYDFLARPARVVPNTAEALPDIAADFRAFTFRIRPGIFFQEHPAFRGRKRGWLAFLNREHDLVDEFVGHRIETSVFHPWVVGFQRQYVDIDHALLDGSSA